MAQGEKIDMRFKILLLPFGAIAELLLMLTCLIVSLIDSFTAKRIAAWCIEFFPDREWYTGKN